MKKKIAILLIILILGLTLFGIYSIFNYEKGSEKDPDPYSIGTNAIGSSSEVEEQDNLRINIGKKMTETKTADGLTIKNIKIVSNISNAEFATITFELENTTNKDLENFWVDVSFIDKNKVNLNSLLFEVNVLKSGETITLTKETDQRVIDSYEYEFKKVETIVGVG